MKKLFISFQKAFKADEHFEHLQTINSLMATTFNENTTADSIKIFEGFKKKFETEIAKRGIDSLIENTTCEEYFDRAHQLNN